MGKPLTEIRTKKYHKANGELHKVKQFTNYNITFKPPIYYCKVCDEFFPEVSVIEK